MKTRGRASLRFQKSGDLSIQAIFPRAHFACVNNRGGLAWTKPIVGSARRAKRRYRYKRQSHRDFFRLIEKHASELRSTTSTALSDAAREPLIQIIESDVRKPEIRRRTEAADCPEGEWSACLPYQYPSPQRYCHAMPTAVNSLPVRVERPVLAESFSEFCRSKGKASVNPARVFRCSLSLLTPFSVV